jgi:hypothetical protein
MNITRALVSTCILPEALELARMIGDYLRTRGSGAVEGPLLEAARVATAAFACSRAEPWPI